MTKKDILIVDDNRMTRDTLALLLDGEGLSVHTCADGISAVHLSEKKRYQVYVIDYNMPGLKGDAVASQLRKLHPHSFMIGYSIESKKQAFLAAGADQFIVKDDLINELIPSIKKALSMKAVRVREPAARVPGKPGHTKD